MANVSTISNQWIPEDDLLLKNSVEAGASLEALAKGAVQFSRRYTLRELRERWHSLLYDPEIAAQASARIFELEISGFCPGSKSNKPEKEISKKRKNESIRRRYYAMRKKFRIEFLNHTDLGFFESNPHDPSTRDGNDQLGLQEEDLDILLHAFPGTIQDAPGTSNQNMGGYGFGENVTSLGECAGKTKIDDNNAVMYAVEKENSSPAYTGEFADPDSLLNLSNEEEILLVDEKDIENKCAMDISNKSSQENDTAKVEPETLEPTEATVDTSGSKVDLPSELTRKCDLVELCHGEICCTLNTEDPEIPCNDDIFLLIHPSMSSGSPTQQPNTTTYEKVNGQDVNSPIKGKDSVHPFASTAKADVPAFVNKTVGNSSKGKSQNTIPKPCSISISRKEEVGVGMKVRDSQATIIRSMEASSASTSIPELLVNDSLSDHEESQIDDDVPYYSDAEAMILEMDLDPDDQGVRQVPSYQYDDTKRTIIRLEQAARSCVQRAMTSQGALALLYGRHLRHYIKKPEVLLGRSTDDFDVDIDLRKEGRANKISRRQAIIKMEADGSFFLKNLGKSSVSVNGMSVATGQVLNLSPSCLIEIKGMSFVFEINQEFVRT
ncbi:Forkhead-associated (FHA) domain-containing protein [Striga hermonthica]|uniref:Forkhead-associated (FHA) domain-containing protein n=1 Tax=Striga hermonthica TaxID=68872 RepID=A0A9N7RN40_STRHE|nr:Forkhead-associated (FHA) domain-containing protein [Striga hermonthica]